jgi:hypothetical protein
MAHITHIDEARVLSMRGLVSEIGAKTALLARKEIDLAKAELKADIRAELAMAKWLGVAALCALLGVNGLLVAAVFALAAYMPGWLAALLLGGLLIVAGAAIGYVSWTHRITDPLPLTRKRLGETVRWAKERLP